MQPPQLRLNIQIFNPPKLAGLSALLSLLITGILLATHNAYWHYYAFGSLYGILWILSYHLKPKHLSFTLALSLARITLFAALACWTGEFSVQKTTVVLIGCFSYKLIIMSTVAWVCCIYFISLISHSPKTEHN